MSELSDRLKVSLPAERFEHSLRVSRLSRELAQKWGVDPVKAETAGLLHDCSRYLDGPGLLELARELNYKIDPIERYQPKLLHARLAADLARRDFKIADPEILKAIAEHTVGSEDMSALSKVIYLADHMEEGRDFKGVEKIRELAQKDLDLAMAESTGQMIRYLLDSEQPIFEGTIRTRNHFLNYAKR